MPYSKRDTLSINTLRLLAVDMVERAGSGHPGMPLGAAPIAWLLFTRFLKHDPADPGWADRDRFVLSAGHASALLYALLHLSGYDLPLEELRQFRQWGSRTPGHPEYGLTPGVETTTGPLGQGMATAVGMAIAEKRLASLINGDGATPIDHRTWVLCSDGDLMEGISAEASSLAGHLQLGKLICLYDSNRISIEGPTSLAFTEAVALRYRAYGWQVLEVQDGNDLDALERAMQEATEMLEAPTLIVTGTHIGYGSPNKQDSADAHGSPLGPDESRLVKARFGFPEESSFLIPPEARLPFHEAARRGRRIHEEWEAGLDTWRVRFPRRAALLEQLQGEWQPGKAPLPLPVFAAGKPVATRKASQQILQRLATASPLMMGGSADLAPSCGTQLDGIDDFSASTPSGALLHFGVREHAMGAILNGLALSGLMPYGATFLVFADYMKPALRLAALMQLPVRLLFTHDSIALGEDGPTHQPIEQLAMLRATPGLVVLRPADANETIEAWKSALQERGPVAIVLSRQALPVLDSEQFDSLHNASKGGYVLADWQSPPADLSEAALVIATGSEVPLALEARALLEEEGIALRVVSMPSRELYERQGADWHKAVLPEESVRRVVVEAASPFGWERYAGASGIVLGIERFGASAPGERVLAEFGFTPEGVAAAVRHLIENRGTRA